MARRQLNAWSARLWQDVPVTDELKLTRRGWLQGIGTSAGIAAGAACRPGASESSGPDAQGAGGTPDAVHERFSLRFELDGTQTELEVEARTTLLDALRLDLNQRGTKRVCDRGACGACMVLVDGRAHNSCMMLAADVQGAKVTSVAGLAQGDKLSALQSAFVKHDATQCGFCTPGMLMSCAALLQLRRPGDPNLGREEARRGIAGNLCRCGTYPNVVDALVSVANAQGAKGVPA